MARQKKKNQLKEEIQQRRRSILRWVGGALVLALLVTSASFAVMKVLHPETLPIRSVRLEGNFKHQDPVRLRSVIGELAIGNFFSVDIAAIQKKLEQQAWVDVVSVRRKWPDTLVIQVVEQKPLAVWSTKGLVNVRGEWFAASHKGLKGKLPELKGPEGSAGMLARRYVEMSKMLEDLGVKLVLLDMNDRRSWKVHLDNGLLIKLGRADVTQRLKRFVRLYTAVIEKQKEKIEAVDMRYTNGFALSWKPQQEDKGVSSRGVKNHV